MNNFYVLQVGKKYLSLRLKQGYYCQVLTDDINKAEKFDSESDLAEQLLYMKEENKYMKYKKNILKYSCVLEDTRALKLGKIKN